MESPRSGNVIAGSSDAVSRAVSPDNSSGNVLLDASVTVTRLGIE